MPGGDSDLELAKQEAKKFADNRAAVQQEKDAQKAAAAEAAKNIWAMRILSGHDIKDVTMEGAEGQDASDSTGWKVNGAASSGSPPAVEIQKPTIPQDPRPVEEKKSPWSNKKTAS